MAFTGERADTYAELDALPLGSVALDAHGRAFQKFSDGWGAAGLGGVHEVIARPATILYRPGALVEITPSEENPRGHGRRFA